MKINCIIVEDEPLALERTKAYVLKLPYLNLLATFDNGVDALVFLKTTAVDLIFLDINMGEFSGIQLLESANHKAQVIFTTAYNEYAIKGFDLSITDYLLKPFTFERFVQAVDKVQSKFTKTDATPDKTFLFVKTEYRLEKILLNEILYIEGMRDYRRIHTATKKIMTLQTFKDFEKEIPSTVICRVHKSYMVAIDKIESVERDRIKLKDVLIPISDTYRKSFFELINHAGK
ncbi:MAG TPA: LytTR family DNA-binding domain-containing protein [Bacteroidia bacterium]|nr:LytTR family DNA-binding domain-containing protein [Bacteroidia bacterium]